MRRFLRWLDRALFLHPADVEVNVPPAMAEARMGSDGILRVEDNDLDEGVFQVVYRSTRMEEDNHGLVEGRFESVLDAVDHVQRMLEAQDTARLYERVPLRLDEIIEVRARKGAPGL